jgi:hypothetical protein
MVINWTGSSPLNAIRQSIIDGRGDIGFATGDWNGPKGFISTFAGGDTFTYGIGYAQNDLQFLGQVASLDGQTANGDAVLVKMTMAADADLDGTVEDDDVTILGAFYGGPGTWMEGDFDYDGTIDDDDVTYLGALYGQSIAPGPIVGGVTAVPEPTSLGLVCLAALPLVRRRRK